MRRVARSLAVIGVVLAGLIGVVGSPASADVPGVLPGTYGTATAFTWLNQSVSFGFQGRITIGGQTYTGLAVGGTALANPLPPFTLSGTSATGTLMATCTGEFFGQGGNPIGYGSGISAGAAISVLQCDGSANGGPPGHVTLVSAYLNTTEDSIGGRSIQYDGVFVGAASPQGLPVISEGITINPNNPVVPGGILDACVTPKSLGIGQICVRL